jgi:hypothetical protein
MSILNSLNKTITIKTRKYKSVDMAYRILESLATDYFQFVCFVENYASCPYLICKESIIPIQVRSHYCGMYWSAKVIFRIGY